MRTGICLLLVVACAAVWPGSTAALEAYGTTRDGRVVLLQLPDPVPVLPPGEALPAAPAATPTATPAETPVIAMAGTAAASRTPALPASAMPAAAAPEANVTVAATAAAVAPPTAAAEPRQVALAAAETAESPGAAAAGGAGGISLGLDSMPLRSVLQGLAEQAGRSLVIGPEVTGAVSATLTNVSFEEALRAILATTPYGYSQRDGVWSVGSLAVETRVLNLTYVEGDAVKEAVAPFLSEKGRVEALKSLTNGDVAGTSSKSKLVVTDIPDRLDRIEAVIRSLDSRPRQVRIEARMVETTVGHEMFAGIRWNLDVSAHGGAAPTTFPFKHDQAPLSDYRAQGDAENSSGGSGSSSGGRQFLPGEFFPTPQREDFVFGIMDASQLSVAVQALNTDQNTNILATPTITTTDGRKAQVLVGQQIPIPIYERQEQTGILEITGYRQQDVGISLDVTPHVGRDGEILMEVTPSTSDIVEFIGQFKDRPITKTRVARTQVVVREGQTLAIAGLITESDLTTHSKVPLLGDVPLLGQLFRHEGTQKRKVELMIFISPTLLKD